MKTNASNTYNLLSYKAIGLIRWYHSFSAVGPSGSKAYA
jgi:hypothetical protein